MDISFRRLTDDDLPLLHRWLNEPGVVLWWEGDDVSWDGVLAEYGSAADPRTHHHLAISEGEPVAWIQVWPLHDYVEEEAEARAWVDAGLDPATTAGIDYLVGEPNHRGHGLGSQMIRQFVDEVVFAAGSPFTAVAADPVVANDASWRALARAGFEPLIDLVHEGHDEPSRLMVRRQQP